MRSRPPASLRPLPSTVRRMNHCLRPTQGKRPPRLSCLATPGQRQAFSRDALRYFSSSGLSAGEEEGKSQTGKAINSSGALHTQEDRFPTTQGTLPTPGHPSLWSKMQPEVRERGPVSAPSLTYCVPLATTTLSLQDIFFHSKIQNWVI